MRKEHAWAVISLKNLRHNVKTLQKKAGQARGVIGVVKSEAYGHGMVPVARELRRCGVTLLAVAELHEAEKLKAARVGGPVMILSRTMPENLPDMVKGGFIQVVGSLQEARLISRAAVHYHRKVTVHLNIDTGMNRLGLPFDNNIKTIKKIINLPGLVAEGIMTHLFASEKPSTGQARQQVQYFQSLVSLLQRDNVRFKYIHFANSGGVVNFTPGIATLVRPGISLYGYHPGKRMPRKADLRPVLTLKARIIGVRELNRGDSVGYNAAWKALKKSRIAVLSVGYGDGYPRSFKNCGTVLVRGKACPVVGTVCMNHTFVDISRVPGVKTGDTAVLYGRQGSRTIYAEEAAAKIDTISYELTCRLAGISKKYSA